MKVVVLVALLAALGACTTAQRAALSDSLTELQKTIVAIGALRR